MRPLTGAILAGGLGTRLRTAIGDRPKVLAAVLGKPFLAYLLDQLVDAGIGRIVLLTGSRSDQVEQTFGAVYRGARLEYSPEPAPLGTAGALALAMPKLFPREKADAVLVLNGDSYCAADLTAFRSFHEQKGADASLVLARVTDTSRFGTVELDDDDRLERFVEKQSAAGHGWINAGIYLLGRRLLDEVPTGRSVSLEREMFPAWLRNDQVYGFRSDGAFLDIGTPESYRAAAAFFQNRTLTHFTNWHIVPPNCD
jgi:D-glycero-alpha-D-manno-heptose 1-phosphate guanylyltransferase